MVISVQVRNPGTELVVSSHDKADFFAVNCMGNWRFFPAPIASEGRGVLRLYHISEEHCIPTILRCQLLTIDGGCWENTDGIQKGAPPSSAPMSDGTFIMDYIMIMK